MAELVPKMLLGPLISTLSQKASKCLTEQFEAMAGMEEQLAVLGRKLPAILDVIADAEEQGAHRAGVGAWLKELKSVAYEANDAFDELKYEELRREAKKKGHHSILGMDIVSLFPAHNPIVFRYRMGNKLRRIVQAIEVLVTEMNAFGFRYLPQARASKQWRQTDSIIDDSEKDIVEKSRDEERKNVLQILIDQADNTDLTVLPIVGMGGLGKTTFAQLIYNDPEIQKHLQLRRWVCVSDDFDVLNLASKISTVTVQEQDREKALMKLQQEVSGKRYFLVLDDVWERDPDKWGKLKTCLNHGAAGSVILTTTRDKEVARIMGTVDEHKLGMLKKRFLKEIFERRAFSLQEQRPQKLVDIVDKIVDRCAGSPLATKALGSVLSTKANVEEWEAVLSKSNILDDDNIIFPILKISYDDLPLHMKQCFAFCAVFPKDYVIDVETLIQLWMANEFIPSQQGIRLETTGHQIFNELAWRSFFQDVEQSRSLHIKARLSFRTKCKIHDLMHDVALSVMGKECATITEGLSHNELLTNPTRHLFLSNFYKGAVLDDFLKKKSPNVQTILPDNLNFVSIPHFSKHSSLQALRFPHVAKVPIRPRRLLHLRYLDLSYSWYIKELPEEISILYNLQTLNLSRCKNLDRLPKDMKYMTGLRHLHTNGCTSLKCMPPDLGQLTSLQTLTYFVVGASSLPCSNIGELYNVSLGGELKLRCLENVTEAHTKAANLGNKERLTHLALKWNSDCHIEELDCHQKVLDALKSYGGLKILRIISYQSTGLPTWMKDLSMLRGLIELHLVNCTLCEDFPQFWHLKAL